MVSFGEIAEAFRLPLQNQLKNPIRSSAWMSGSIVSLLNQATACTMLSGRKTVPLGFAHAQIFNGERFSASISGLFSSA